jgi:hypothetical protein
MEENPMTDRPFPWMRPWMRVQVGALSAVVLVLCTAQSCDSVPVIRILTPKAGLDVTYAPLWIEIDHWGFADPATFEVLLNGVDITDAFELEVVESFRIRATAQDVWGAGVVNEGANTLVASIGGWQDVRVFQASGDPHADLVASFAPGPGAGYGQAELPDVVTGGPRGLGLFQGGLDVLSLGAGGSVVLELADNVILDGPGVDFTVFENPFLTVVSGIVASTFAEPGRVSVSQDGVVWHAFAACATAPLEPPLHPGCAGVFPTLSDVGDPLAAHPGIPTGTPISDLIGVPQAELVLPEGSGGDSFDLADLGLGWARFVRVEDVGPAVGQAGTVGLDLDAVTAVHSGPPTDANENGVPDAAE